MLKKTNINQEEPKCKNPSKMKIRENWMVDKCQLNVQKNNYGIIWTLLILENNVDHNFFTKKFYFSIFPTVF